MRSNLFHPSGYCAPVFLSSVPVAPTSSPPVSTPEVSMQVQPAITVIVASRDVV